MTEQEAAEVGFEAYDSVLRLAPTVRSEFEDVALIDAPKPPKAEIFSAVLLACRGRILMGPASTVQ